MPPFLPRLVWTASPAPGGGSIQDDVMSHHALALQ